MRLKYGDEYGNGDTVKIIHRNDPVPMKPRGPRPPSLPKPSQEKFTPIIPGTPDTPKSEGTPPILNTPEISDIEYWGSATPEPLFRVQSDKDLALKTVSENMRDNREDYIIYERPLRLSPVCGKRPCDHVYRTNYYRRDTELPKNCDICDLEPYKLREISARCIDCEAYLCIRCYNKHCSI